MFPEFTVRYLKYLNFINDTKMTLVKRIFLKQDGSNKKVIVFAFLVLKMIQGEAYSSLLQVNYSLEQR